MNWKVVGLVVGLALILGGFVALHGGMGKVSAATLMDSGNDDNQGPHPPSSDAWQTIAPAPLDGPHPPSSDGWHQ